MGLGGGLFRILCRIGLYDDLLFGPAQCSISLEKLFTDIAVQLRVFGYGSPSIGASYVS